MVSLHCAECDDSENSYGVILPKVMLERSWVGKDDNVHVIETEQDIERIPYNPEFANQMETAERATREDRSVLSGSGGMCSLHSQCDEQLH